MKSEYGKCTKKCLAARLRPDPLGKLKVPQAPRRIYGRAGQWGSDGGKDKGADERVGRGEKEGEIGKEMKEKREGLCLAAPLHILQ